MYGVQKPCHGAVPRTLIYFIGQPPARPFLQQAISLRISPVHRKLPCVKLRDTRTILCSSRSNPEAPGFNCLTQETEARWKLVESAWQMGVSKNLLAVHHDNENNSLFTTISDRRVTITSSRDSLNGYQKGRCFYCFDAISIESGHDELADVDHFMPWMLRKELPLINGMWNLVLACKDCNRGIGGKFEQLPALALLERLHDRNEYFINSHLPIRETLIKQTGNNEQQRRAFLQDCYNKAKAKKFVHCCHNT